MVSGLESKILAGDSETKKSRWRLGMKLAIAVFVLLLSSKCFYIFAGGNFYTVVPGSFYRCSQLSPSRLESVIRKNNIKTVVNLRGCCDTVPWYMNQVQAIHDSSISQEDLSFSAGRLPSTKTIRQLVSIIDQGEKPMLFHCHKGIDRTGMAVVMSELLQTDTSLDEALKQLSPYYGHLNIGRTAHIDEFFVLYRDWLASKGESHESARFRDWVLNHYVPGDCAADLKLIGETGDEIHLEKGRSKLLRVQAENTSIREWVMKPGTNAGIKVKWMVLSDDRKVPASGFAGNFKMVVPPGKSVEIPVVLPPMKEAGKFLLRLDMTDPQHAAFHQAGSEILELKVVVK
jgi:Tyrosine phosphatase family